MNFSLLEVNLVILVVSLLFSLSVGATKLYKTVNLQLYLAEIIAVKTDIAKFYDIYNFWPGDIPYDVPGGGCLAFSDGSDICHGDGNGKIVDKSEGYLAWLHLATINKQFFTSKSGVSKFRAVIGSNVKSSKAFSNVGMQILGDTKLNNHDVALPADKPNYLRMAGARASGNLLAAVFSAPDLYYIDQKIDDTMPFSGVLFADSGSDVEPGCVTSEGLYNLNNKQILCYQQMAL